MTSMTIVLTDREFEDTAVEMAAISGLGLNIKLVDANTRDEDKLASVCKHADAVLNQNARLTAQIISAMQACRVIVRMGVGVDNVDVREATVRDIPVVHIPDYGHEEVATHAMALLLSLWQRLNQADQDVKQGRWDFRLYCPVRRLSTCTLGLVGFGRIAREVAKRAHSFGMHVVAFDPYVEPQMIQAHGAVPTGLYNLLEQSDVVSLHVPLSEATHHLIDSTALSHVRQGAMLVNTSRGGVVDEGALVAALESGQLSSAGLDVLSAEPPVADNPLFRMRNVILTPHMAWYSEEALFDVRQKSISAAIEVLQGLPARNIVNASDLKIR